MNNKNIIIDKTKSLLNVRCYDGLKEAAEAWLKAVDTKEEKNASEKYVAELEESVMDIDTVINAFENEKVIEKFGVEKATQIANHAKEIKANGAKWCDCPACTAGLDVLKYKNDLLA